MRNPMEPNPFPKPPDFEPHPERVEEDDFEDTTFDSEGTAVLDSICSHCHQPIKIRNPTGKCDHLHYPECCPTCQGANAEAYAQQMYVSVLRNKITKRTKWR